ncbi:MAG: DnaA ATPase domain-containing protein [bacterium]
MASRVGPTPVEMESGEREMISAAAELFRERLRARIGDGAMVVWFGDGIEIDLDPLAQRLQVTVPTNFFRERISSRFLGDLRAAAEEETGIRGWTVAIDLPGAEGQTATLPAVPGETEPKPLASQPLRKTVADVADAGLTLKAPPANVNPKPEFALEPPRPATRRAAGRPAKPAEPAVGLNWPSARAENAMGHVPGLFGEVPVKAARRLDNFVVGTCNRMAYTAAAEIVKTRGAAFNPLVVHGGVGLGKTHLLDGVAHAVRSNAGGGRLIHVTAEAFTNAFLEAIRTNQLASFRSRFRNAAALVVDDVQFLAAKRATQTEFLHMFDTLLADDVPIVLSCDQHPRRVNRLTDELASRFMAGMVVRLETPDPELRRLILRTKAAARGVAISDAVIDMLAEHLRVSVRELEGALNSLIAHSVLTGRRIDADLARQVLRENVRHTAQQIGLKDVERAISDVFSLNVDLLHARHGGQSISIPRSLALYLARRHTKASYTEIARHFGLKNHSSVIAAEKKIREELECPEKSRSLAGFVNMGDMVAAVQANLGV